MKKRCFITSLLLLTLYSFALCPRVPLHPISRTKNSPISHLIYHLIILNTSIKSDLFLVSSKLHNCSFSNLSVEGNSTLQLHRALLTRAHFVTTRTLKEACDNNSEVNDRSHWLKLDFGARVRRLHRWDRPLDVCQVTQHGQNRVVAGRLQTRFITAGWHSSRTQVENHDYCCSWLSAPA